MYVAVTGASGFIGSHVVATARQRGHTVRCIVRNPTKMRDALAQHGLGDDEGVDVAQGDLADEASLRAALDGPDAVVHAAAVFSLNPNDAAEMAEINPGSVRTVLGLAEELGLSRVVYVSTMGVFLPVTTTHVDQDTPLGAGCGPYTESKIAAEHVAREAVARGAPVVSVYPGAVLGPRDPNPDLSDSEVVIRDAVKGRIPMSIAGATMPIVDVRDVAAVCVGALEGGSSSRYLVPGELVGLDDVFATLNDITGGDLKLRDAPAFVFTSMGAVADVVARITRRKMPVTRETVRMLVAGARTAEVAFDWDPAKTDFGVPAYDVETTLRDTVSWMYTAGHLSADEAGSAAADAA